MSRPRVAWVLNLDADLELAAIATSGAAATYTPKRSVLEAMRSFVPVVARSLLAPDDVLVGEDAAPLCANGLQGRAFSPTPRALRLLRRAGAEPEPHPSIAVLCRVSSRAFSSSLGTTLPDAGFVCELEAARVKLEKPPSIGDAWRVKRAFGMTGRGHRVIAAGPVGEADLAFVAASMREGGAQIEPNVAIVDEYAIHGMLAESGALRLGAVVRQRCDERGAWLATECVASPPAVAGGLSEEATRAGRALAEAGYFGPFGIDAYTYRDRDGTIRFQPRSEINARYTMGFAIGFGAV